MTLPKDHHDGFNETATAIMAVYVRSTDATSGHERRGWIIYDGGRPMDFVDQVDDYGLTSAGYVSIPCDMQFGSIAMQPREYRKVRSRVQVSKVPGVRLSDDGRVLSGEPT